MFMCSFRCSQQAASAGSVKMADLAGTASRAKIKGGRWTVARFFMVSMAYTSAWLAVCSQLDYFRSLYGPQVLLQLNIAYYLPTVPLLVVSSFLDRFLDRKLGVARTILVRILVGLLGYAGLCIWLPFQPARLRLLLGTAVGMGLFSGLAFSASYQLVSRFANKNVIALGLGCSASAPLVLLMELAFGIGTHATSHEQRLLYCSVGVIVVTGTAAAISLLLRHWDAVESHASGRMGQDGVADATAEEGIASAGAATAPAIENLGTQRTAPLEIGSAAASDDEAAESTPTPLPPPLIAYGSLEPYRTFLSTDEEVHDADGSFHGPTPRELSRLDSNLKLGDRSTSFRRGSSHEAASGSAPEELAPLLGGAAEQESGASEGERVTRAVLTRIWAPLLCMFVSSAIALTIFPFFTYVPSSGLFGETFPRVGFGGWLDERKAGVLDEQRGPYVRHAQRQEALNPSLPIAVRRSCSLRGCLQTSSAGSPRAPAARPPRRPRPCWPSRPSNSSVRLAKCCICLGALWAKVPEAGQRVFF